MNAQDAHATCEPAHFHMLGLSTICGREVFIYHPRHYYTLQVEPSVSQLQDLVLSPDFGVAMRSQEPRIAESRLFGGAVCV